MNFLASFVEAGSNMTEGYELPNDPVALRDQLTAALAKIRDLENQLQQAAAESRSAGRASADSGMDVAPINEADVTLRRLVQRIAMILQSEKIVIMFYDRELGELIGIPPAYGVEEDRINHFRVRATQGISGQVFRDSTPAIFHDANSDPRTVKDPFALLHVQNGITVPLVLEKRDEENRVIERTTIGVLHAFNKRHGEDFNDEDVRLLERMAKNVGSIIANLQLYREVVEEREELLQTFESLTAGLVLISADGRISQMNASGRAIFGVTGNVNGTPYQEIIRDKLFQALFEAAIKNEDTSGIEMSLDLAGKIERIYQVQAARVTGEDGRDLGVVAILNDITEIKNIERMKSSFVAMASHELRTPLTAIKGFTSTLMMDDDFSDAERKEFLMIIDQECDRLRRLIDDLLNTARIESGESLKPSYSRVPLRELLDKVVMIQRQATSRHSISLDVQGEIPEVVGDQDKLDQILTNLLNNAIKYSPNGGDIVVHATVKDEHVLIGVEDHGMGIPADHVNKVFERFHRVDNEDNRKIYGTGLGLFLVKHLVESVHLGTIWCDSEVGKGSTFWFTVPVELDIEKANAMND